jgi:uncharacterized phage protein (TIGR02216 family)
MQLGFGVLRHSSKTFWSLTPRELFAAVANRTQATSEAGLRSSLAALMTQFPDKEGQEIHDGSIE